MRGAINYLRGTVRVELTSKYSERAVNICAANGVDFWDLERTDDGASRMSVNISGYLKLREVADRSGAFSVRIIRRRGAPFLLWRIRKRYVLLAGMVLCLAAVTLSSFFVWQIDVTGNETVSTSRILASLRSLGVDIGTSTFKISQERISNRMLLLVPELSWITLNTHGSRIEVVVREKVPKPEILDPDVPTAVYAAKAGIITEMEILEGWSAVEAGDTVDVGDELISSYVPVGDGRFVHAEGRITARTWYEFTLSTPLETVKKEYTGRTRRRRALILAGKRINLYFFGGNPYEYYDKISQYDTLIMPGGSVLPVTLVTDSFEEYERVSSGLPAEEAERLLRSRLMYMLEREIGDGSVTSTSFEKYERDGLLYVTLRAECLEEIGRPKELAPEELIPTPADS